MLSRFFPVCFNYIIFVFYVKRSLLVDLIKIQAEKIKTRLTNSRYVCMIKMLFLTQSESCAKGMSIKMFFDCRTFCRTAIFYNNEIYREVK